MNGMKKIISILSFATAITSCSLDSGIIQENEIVKFEIGSDVFFSRTATEGYSTSFVDGDSIGLFAVKDNGEIKASNVKLLYDSENKSWDASITKVENESLKYYAYYPYKKDLQSYDEITHSVETDQSDEKNFNQSDFLVAEVESTASTTVALLFSHVLSYVQVTVNGEGLEIDNVSLKDVKKTTKYSFSTSDGIKLEDETAVIKMQKVGDSNVYRAVVPAQTIAGTTDFVQVETGGKIYSFATGTSGLNIEPGKVCKLSVTPTAASETSSIME